MKVAISISGQARMFKSSYLSFEKYILKNLDCDIFIDTWSYELSKKCEEFSISDSWRYTDEGDIEEFKNIYNPVVFKLEEYTDEKEKFFVEKSRLLSPNIRADDFVKRYLCMLYKIQSAQNLVNDYSEKNNIQYDIVIRTRSDVEYKDFLTSDLLHKLKDGNLLIDSYGNGRNRCGDVLAIGLLKDMDSYCNLYNYIEQYKQNGIEVNTEIALPHHLKANNINYEIINLIHGIIRPKSWTIK